MTSHRLDTLAALVVLILVPFMLYADGMSHGDVLLSASAERHAPWGGGELVGRAADGLRENLVYRMYIQDCWQRGELAWWSPYAFGGFPFAAENHVQALYPVSWAVAPFDPFSMTTVLFAFHLAVAGVGMFLFLLALGMPTGAAALGGIAFGLNGMFGARHMHAQYPATASWLPWVLLGVQQIWRGERSLGIGIAAAATALLVLAGHPSMYVFGGYALVVWTLYVVWNGPEGTPDRTVFLCAALAAVLGVCMASAQLAGTLEVAGLSKRAHQSADLMTSGLFPPSVLIRTWLPLAFGSLFNDFWSPWGSGFAPGMLYIGIIPLFAAGHGLRHGAHRHVVGLSLLGFGAIMFVEPAFRLGWMLIPGLDFSRVDRLSVACFLLVPIAVATGVQSMMERKVPDPRREVAWGALLGVLLAGGGAVAVTLLASTEPNWALRLRQQPLQTDVVHMLLFWAAAVAGRYALRVGWRPQMVLAGWVLLTAADLSIINRDTVVMRDGDDMLAPTPGIEWLQAQPRPLRIAKVGGLKWTDKDHVFPANLPTIYGIEDLHGFGPLTPGFTQRLVGREQERGWSTPWAVRPFSEQTARSPLLDRLAITHLVSVQQLQLDGWSWVHSGDMNIYQRDEPAPRAWVATSWNHQPDDEAAASALRDRAMSRRVLLPEPLNIPKTLPRDASVRWVTASPNTVTLQKSGSAAALVVLADTYHPGWTAYIDGAPSEVLRANVAQRAVVVPKGEHTIVFRYETTYWWWTRWLVLFGFSSTLAALAWGLRQRSKAG